MCRVELLVSGIALLADPGSWNFRDRGRIRGELMAGPGQFAVVPEVGLPLLGLAASLFHEARARLDLHPRANGEGKLVWFGWDEAEALLLLLWRLDELHFAHFRQRWHLRWMDVLQPMLPALGLNPLHGSADCLLVPFDLRLAFGSKRPVQIVPVVIRDGLLRSMWHRLPARNIPLDELQPDFAVFAAYLR